MESILEFIPVLGLIVGTVMGYMINSEAIIYYIAYALLITTAIQFAGHFALRIKMKKSTLITGLVVMAFCAATVLFKNEAFIYIKPTVVSWAFALGFYLLPKIKDKTAFDYILNGQMEVPKPVMTKANNWWVWFNFLAGLVNLLIFIGIENGMVSKDWWVSYKFILIGVSMVFTGFIIYYLFKHNELKEEGLK